MSQEETAYEQVGNFYKTAVDVTLFTWRMFAARNAVLLGAAGYLCLTPPHLYGIAATLLFIAAGFAFITAKQTKDNQRVIQRTLAAGCLLEYEHPGLGCLFQHSVDKDAREDMEKTYRGTKELVADEHLRHFGLKPNTTLFAVIYATLYAGLAILAIVLGENGCFVSMLPACSNG